MGEHSAFYREIEGGPRQRQVAVYTCWTDTLFSSGLLEAIECEGVNVCNSTVSADG